METMSSVENKEQAPIGERQQEQHPESSIRENSDKVASIVNKWLTLQKTIKEEITLEEIINNQKDANKKTMQERYRDYYHAKLKTRETFENVIYIDNDKEKRSCFELVEDSEKLFNDVFSPVQNLVLILRNNYDYVGKIISIGDENEEYKDTSINTLVDLFCHQFYDNIGIPNSEQEELLIGCYLLLQKEISSMNSASFSSFIDEKSSFIGKFLKSFTKKQELKSYLSITLGSLILSIENSGDSCWELNPTRILETIKKEEGVRSSFISEKGKWPSNSGHYINSYDYDGTLKYENLQKLTQEIPKCKININNNIYSFDDDDIEIGDELEAEGSAAHLNDNNESNENTIQADKPAFSDGALDITSSDNLKYDRISKGNNDINSDYSIDLNQDELNKRIREEKDKNGKEFYLKQLEKINKDPNIFTNQKFIRSLEEIDQFELKVLMKYKRNFISIKDKIDHIIQSGINKITTIPYALRCICKIIHMLILKKFPKISTYEHNAFIGEFIFGKCILPILINSDINAIIITTILSVSTRQCLKIIAKVLTKINRGLFFEANIDTDFTIFNHYIIEVIPIINTFYSQGIDVELPKVLNELIEKHISQPAQPRERFNIFRFNSNETASQSPEDNNKSDKVKQPTVHYDYFKENKDEGLNLKCICVSIDDIFQLVKIVKHRLKDFQDLPQYLFFSKTIDKIIVDQHKLYNENKNSKVTQFALIFQEELNPEFQMKKENRDTAVGKCGMENEIIFKKVKFCIKTIGIGLNLINNKDYSYLNMAKTTNLFFKAVKNTLDDLNDVHDNEMQPTIPGNWYSQYLHNNKDHLPDVYKHNDFEKGYEDIKYDEDKLLEFLKTHSSIVITRNGGNIRCAEKIIEKAKRDLSRIKQIERFMKMQKFLDKSEIDVCIQAKKWEKQTGFFGMAINRENDQSQPKIIVIKRTKECDHTKIKLLSPGDADETRKYHANTVKRFINRFGMIDCVKEEVQTGKQVHEVYKSLEKYLNFIKEAGDTNKIMKKDGEEEKKIILDKIEEHVMIKLYKKVFPPEPSKGDIDFEKQTYLLKWIQPEHLEIKPLYISELQFAKDCMRKIDNAKSVQEKGGCIASAYTTINNTIKFSMEKDVDAGADDLSPIFQYILIKARPKRFYSNIYYIKAFLPENKGKGNYGFLLSQMDFASRFITELTFDQLKITEQEYNDNMKQSLNEWNRKGQKGQKENKK